eukprot:3794190-Rhodomonas_salina.1
MPACLGSVSVSRYRAPSAAELTENAIGMVQMRVGSAVAVAAHHAHGQVRCTALPPDEIWSLAAA